jgi:3-deoxy-D-manno-octulosonic-acid transferase
MRQILGPYLGYLLFHLLTAPYLALSGIRRAKRRGHQGVIAERFRGGSNPPKPGPWFVIIAGGMGEIRAAIRLAEGIAEDHDVNIAVLVQSYTATQVQHPWLTLGVAPFNNPIAVWLFLRRWKPSGLMVIEFWDNTHLKFETLRRGIPTAVVNVPITDEETARVLRKNERWRWLIPTRYAVQSALHRERMLRLGVPEYKIEVTGPLAMAISRGPDPSSIVEKWRDILGLEKDPGPVIVAGSTWEEDEIEVLAAFRTIRKHHPSAILLLAPRDFDRPGGGTSILDRESIKFVSRTNGFDSFTEDRVILLDSYGELKETYAVATVAFIGGTFEPVRGGHSPVEALAWGVPIAMGPLHPQQVTIVEILTQNDIVEIVAASEDLARHWQRAIEDADWRQRIAVASESVRAQLSSHSVSLYEDLVGVNSRR